jgi:hypothetical protein
MGSKRFALQGTEYASDCSTDGRRLKCAEAKVANWLLTAKVARHTRPTCHELNTAGSRLAAVPRYTTA